MTDHRPLPKGSFAKRRISRLFLARVALTALAAAIWHFVPSELYFAVDPWGAFGQVLVWLLVVIGVPSVLFYGVLWILIGRMHSPEAQRAAQRALAEGNYALAEESFARIAHKLRWFGPLAAEMRFYSAVARIYRGNLQGAIDVLGVFNQTHAHDRGSSQLALAYTLRGDMEAAHAWRAEAEKRAPKTARTAQQVYLDALIDTREGRYDEAVRRLDEEQRLFESSLTARGLRPARVLRAFALAHSSAMPEAGTVDAAVQSLMPATPGEFAMFCAEWPEMAAFLASRGLTPAPANGAP